MNYTDLACCSLVSHKLAFQAGDCFSVTVQLMWDLQWILFNIAGFPCIASVSYHATNTLIHL
jgi:hypothetical protein